MLKSVSPAAPWPAGVVAVADPQPRSLPLPLFPIRASCGFPSPAEDFYGAHDTLDISQRLVANPVATFYVEADTGTSMVEFGIFPGEPPRFLRRLRGLSHAGTADSWFR